jgi:hypothetical protein
LHDARFDLVGFDRAPLQLDDRRNLNSQRHQTKGAKSLSPLDLPIEDALDGFRIAHADGGTDLPIGRNLRAHLAHLGEHGLLFGVWDQIFQRFAGFGSASRHLNDIEAERAPASAEYPQRCLVLLHVADVLANPVALVLNQFADAVACSTPMARKRMAGVGSWPAIGDEGHQATMSAVAHTAD